MGNYGRTVGLIGASRIGRRVIELLRLFDLEVCLFDPYVDAAGAAELGVWLVDLDMLLRISDVVSVHAFANLWIDRLVGAEQFALMRDGVMLINTARGSFVDTDALIGYF